ncbi:hypothetical protein [Burkholderia alba]|uniref:hypothetical protein n=1 Tax=Burkholderia alba TaxID=2683677 RepID=UPI002B053521|nr:hypothetical protein [Burkholderia alba]
MPSLTRAEQKALLNASIQGPEAIDAVLEVLRRANPHAFHSAESLTNRTFFDEPVQNLPCRGHVRRRAIQSEGA